VRNDIIREDISQRAKYIIAWR